MKKILVAATAAVALATPALAFDIKWSGDFNHRFTYSTQADLARNTALSGEGNGFINVSDAAFANSIDTEKKKNDSDFFGDLKYRLTLTATDDDKKVKGVLGFEFGGRKFGQVGGLDFGGDDNIFEFRWGYVDFEVPFDKSSRLSVGLMPVGYNKFLWSDNAAGVKWASKRGNLGYSLAWFRDDVNNVGGGGAVKLQNDDAYAFDITYAVPQGPKLNAFAIYLEEGQEAVAGLNPNFMDQQLWYGLAGEGQVGALFYGFTGIYLTGEADARGLGVFTNPSATIPEHGTLDRKAYLLNAEATYKLDKLRIKGGWLYTSGDDDPNDDELENFANIDAYMGGFGSVVIFDGIADDNTANSAPFIRDRGLNMPYLSVDYDMTAKTSFGASYLYVAAAEDIKTAQGLNGDKFLGHELTARASHKVTKNLTTAIEAGYLIGGDAWDNLATNTGAAGPPVVPVDLKDEADNVFRTNVGIRYTF
jgi:hypothetical protein